MTTPELLTHILYELRTLRKELTAKPAPRVFVPEEVRKALGADRVDQIMHGKFWELTVRFGPVARALGPIQENSAYYSAISSECFTTEEAIEIINRQRPTVPA